METWPLGCLIAMVEAMWPEPAGWSNDRFNPMCLLPLPKSKCVRSSRCRCGNPWNWSSAHISSPPFNH